MFNQIIASVFILMIKISQGNQFVVSVREAIHLQ